jgi:hypothetical protein
MQKKPSGTLPGTLPRSTSYAADERACTTACSTRVKAKSENAKSRAAEGHLAGVARQLESQQATYGWMSSTSAMAPSGSPSDHRSSTRHPEESSESAYRRSETECRDSDVTADLAPSAVRPDDMCTFTAHLRLGASSPRDTAVDHVDISSPLVSCRSSACRASPRT